MTIVRWEPAPRFASAARDGDRVVASVVDPSASCLRDARWIPPVDLEEMDESYLLVADLPGVADNDIAIDVENGVLTLSGTRAAETVGDVRAIRSERDRGAFKRRIGLPEDVDADQITASLDHGVLEIEVPKPTVKRPRRVSVRLAGSCSTPEQKAGGSDVRSGDDLVPEDAGDGHASEPVGAAA